MRQGAVSRRPTDELLAAVTRRRVGWPDHPRTGALMADHRATSRRALEAFNTGEFDSLEGVYTADCVVHDSQNVFAVDQHGLDVLRGQVSMFRAASPNLKMTIDA